MSRDSLREIIAQAISVPTSRVTSNASSGTLEEWDSLGHLNIILAVEGATNVKFSTSEIPQLTSLVKLEDALRRHGWDG
jgi:acyl carrier protein